MVPFSKMTLIYMRTWKAANPSWKILRVGILRIRNIDVYLRTCMDYGALEALDNYSSSFFKPCVPKGWNLLLCQRGELPADKTSVLWDLTHIPPFPWGHLSVPLWDFYTNWRVLQATVHVDNESWQDKYEGAPVQDRNSSEQGHRQNAISADPFYLF